MQESGPSVEPHEPGHPDAHRDDRLTTEEKDVALDRIVLEGRPRLHRSWHDLVATSIVAGFEVGFGILALLTVEAVTGSRLLGALAFSIGFIALRLGHSELFTEGFLVPVTVVAAREATVWHLLRLWGVSLVGNLVGGLVFVGIVVLALPNLHEHAVRTGAEFAHAGSGWQVFALALLAGAAITLLTRMQNGTDDDLARIVAAVGMAFVIVGVGLHHAILDSILIFLGIAAGATAYGWADWVPWFAVAVVGNTVGGVGLVTVLRLVRSSARLERWRETGGPH